MTPFCEDRGTYDSEPEPVILFLILFLFIYEFVLFACVFVLLFLTCLVFFYLVSMSCFSLLCLVYFHRVAIPKKIKN